MGTKPKVIRWGGRRWTSKKCLSPSYRTCVREVYILEHPPYSTEFEKRISPHWYFQNYFLLVHLLCASLPIRALQISPASPSSSSYSFLSRVVIVPSRNQFLSLFFPLLSSCIILFVTFLISSFFILPDILLLIYIFIYLTIYLIKTETSTI